MSQTTNTNTIIHTITSEQLSISVQQTGTELCSIKSLKTGKEFIWQANQEIWGSHAPVLFPAIGSFKNNTCFIEGENYQIPKHGFIRHNTNLVLQPSASDTLHFQLKHNNNTLAMYPFEFEFNIFFKLEKSQLTISHEIINQGNKPMSFALGAHPAFNCPINNNETYEDYYLEFEYNENASTTLLSADGLISDRTKPVLDNTKILALHKNLFDNDALIFKKLKSKKVQLKSNKSTQVLTMSYPDFSYLGIWAKPNAPFVCLEPWNGIADHEKTDGDFLKKDGLICLAPTKTYTAAYTITIED